MKTNIYKSIFLLLMVGVLMSCNQQTSSTSQISNAPISDTVLKDIPEYFSGKLLREKKNLQDSLHITDLENGFSGMQIRIWVGSITDTLKLLDLIYSDSIWKGNFYNIIYKSSLDGRTMNYTGSLRSSKVPKIGWKEYMEKLFQLDILTLPHYSLIPNYNATMDATGVTVEISNQKMYRVYTYASPYESKHISEAAKMIKILGLTEKEFDIKW